MPRLLSAVLLALPLLCHAESDPWAGDGNVGAAPAAQVLVEPIAPQRDAAPRRAPQARPQPASRARTAEQASYRSGKAGSEASRCDMARDIKSDRLAQSYGMPIDATDLQTAENDIRRFCR